MRQRNTFFKQVKTKGPTLVEVGGLEPTCLRGPGLLVPEASYSPWFESTVLRWLFTMPWRTGSVTLRIPGPAQSVCATRSHHREKWHLRDCFSLVRMWGETSAVKLITGPGSSQGFELWWTCGALPPLPPVFLHYPSPQLEASLLFPNFHSTLSILFQGIY